MDYTSNSSNGSFSDQVKYGNKVPWIAVFSLQLLLSIIFNTLIVRIIYKDNRLKTTTNYLMANMAVSDLVVSIYIPYEILIVIYDGIWPSGFSDVTGNAICRVASFIVATTSHVSLYNCFFISVDRYYAIAHPMARPLQHKIRYTIAGIWAFSLLTSAPVFYFTGTIKDKRDMVCFWAEQSISTRYFQYYSIVKSLMAAIPSFIMPVFYSLAVYKLSKHKIPGDQANANMRRRRQQNKNVLKMSIAIVVFVYGSFATFSVLMHLRRNALDHLSKSTSKNLDYASVLIFSISCVGNFVIYLLFNGVYRENIKGIVTKCCGWLNCCPNQTEASNPEAY